MPTAYSQVVQELISSLNDSCNICVSEIIFFCLFVFEIIKTAQKSKDFRHARANMFVPQLQVFVH